jgi:excisionase family DNA binding protein
MERYLSVGDAAKVLGVVPATVKLMVRSGRLQPAARTDGGLHLFAPAAVEKLAEMRAANGGRLPSVHVPAKSQEVGIDG